MSEKSEKIIQEFHIDDDVIVTRDSNSAKSRGKIDTIAYANQKYRYRVRFPDSSTQDFFTTELSHVKSEKYSVGDIVYIKSDLNISANLMKYLGTKAKITDVNSHTDMYDYDLSLFDGNGFSFNHNELDFISSDTLIVGTTVLISADIEINEDFPAAYKKYLGTIGEIIGINPLSYEHNYMVAFSDGKQLGFSRSEFTIIKPVSQPITFDGHYSSLTDEQVADIKLIIKHYMEANK